MRGKERRGARGRRHQDGRPKSRVSIMHKVLPENANNASGFGADSDTRRTQAARFGNREQRKNEKKDVDKFNLRVNELFHDLCAEAVP